MAQHAWAWLLSLLPHRHWFLSDIQAPPHTSLRRAAHQCLQTAKVSTKKQETAIKQVLTGWSLLSLHKMMQSDNNLPAGLRVKFYLSFRNVAQFYRITVALLLFPLKRHLKLEMDFSTIKLFCDWPARHRPAGHGKPVSDVNLSNEE